MSFVYAYYRNRGKRGPYYIGMVRGDELRHLEHRIYEHAQEKKFQGFTGKWYIYFAQGLTAYDAKWLESCLIAEHAPGLLMNVAEIGNPRSSLYSRDTIKLDWIRWKPGRNWRIGGY